jgi:hypothetical protein
MFQLHALATLFLPAKKYPGSVLSHQLATNVLLPLGRKATWHDAGVAGGLLISVTGKWQQRTVSVLAITVFAPPGKG